MWRAELPQVPQVAVCLPDGAEADFSDEEEPFFLSSTHFWVKARLVSALFPDSLHTRLATAKLGLGREAGFVNMHMKPLGQAAYQTPLCQQPLT